LPFLIVFLTEIIDLIYESGISFRGKYEDLTQLFTQ